MYAIDAIEKVELGGLLQKIHIRSTSADNPILLFLHGGPGISNRHSVMSDCSDLCDDFTIVAWDQRGTGGSYKGCDPATLTVERLVEDARELCEYLCKKLGKEKVFLLGGSWGTELGTFLAYRYPEHVGGYVGYGQVVDGCKNEEICYKFSYDKALEAKDEKSLEILRRVGPPVNGQYTPCFEGLMAQRKIMKKYGGHSTKKGGYFKTAVLPILCSGEYTLEDKIGMIKGYSMVLSHMWPTLTMYDFKTDCNTFRMPYYIFQGRLDKNTPSELVEDYFNSITAPDKALVWFENSAHGPIAEEPEKFKKLLREKLLAIK